MKTTRHARQVARLIDVFRQAIKPPAAAQRAQPLAKLARPRHVENVKRQPGFASGNLTSCPKCHAVR